MVTRDRGYWATVGGKASVRRGRPLTEWRGILPPAEVTEIYRRTDLFIFPTQCEGFPLVVIEAIAAGLPVLVSDSLAPGIVIDDRKDPVIAGHDRRSTRRRSCAWLILRFGRRCPKPTRRMSAVSASSRR